MEAELGTLYDANKQLVKQQPPMDKGKLNNALVQVKRYLEERTPRANNYYMLLCNDRKDYTVFNVLKHQKDNFNDFVFELRDCLQNRGDIIFFDKTDDKTAFEIWLKIDDDAFCYYLFPYNDGVIEV